MKYITISDDDIDFVTSKWLLDSALNCGCNSFTFDLDKVPCERSLQAKNELVESLKPFYLGVFDLERLVIYIPQPNTQVHDCWKLNQDSLKIIVKHMGRHLLDWDAAMNSGILNWRFFVDGVLRAGAAYQDDYFLFLDPPEGLMKVLDQKNIPVFQGERHNKPQN
jgi:hypothetical protein